MHRRVTDWYGVTHYADSVWYREVAGKLLVPRCKLGREKRTPPLEEALLSGAPRGKVVTCLFCWHLRLGARSG